MNASLATDTTTIATDFARTIAGGDRAALLRLLDPNVRFRALTPSRAWELDSADAVVDTILGTWFGGDRHIDGVDSIESEMVGDVARVGYRFRATTPTGPAIVEQQAYLEAAGDSITAVRLVCSGYRATTS